MSGGCCLTSRIVPSIRPAARDSLGAVTVCIRCGSVLIQNLSLQADEAQRDPLASPAGPSHRRTTRLAGDFSARSPARSSCAPLDQTLAALVGADFSPRPGLSVSSLTTAAPGCDTPPSGRLPGVYSEVERTSVRLVERPAGSFGV